MSEVNESDVVKIIAQHAKEYNALILKHNTLLKVHKKTVEEFASLESKAYDLRKIIKQWEVDNKTLQESLDGAEREIERVNESREKMQDYILRELPEDNDYFEQMAGEDI